MTFPSIGLSLCVRRQSCHTSSWHSVVLVIGSVRCFSPQLLSIASCSYQLGWVLWKIAVAKQSWNKTYSGSIPIKDKGERGQAESKFSLQVTDLAPVKREGKDEKLSRNNSDHSAAPREPWQSPKVLVQRTLLIEESLNYPSPWLCSILKTVALPHAGVDPRSCRWRLLAVLILSTTQQQVFS